MTTDCESVRGEWGDICPDCGKPLPTNPGPLRSWNSQRPLVFPSGKSAALGDRNPVLVAARARRGLGLTARQAEIRRIVDKNGGNQHAAARELGVSRATITVSLRRSDQVRP